jgi:hypothetical protein
MYAYDAPPIKEGKVETTILQRPKDGRSTQRNDDLSI